MLLQLVRPKETFVAQLTNVAIIACVDPHMVVQVISARITLIALFTLKRFILGVCEQVSLELIFTVKGLHTTSVTAKGTGESWSCIWVVN